MSAIQANKSSQETIVDIPSPVYDWPQRSNEKKEDFDEKPEEPLITLTASQVKEEHDHIQIVPTQPASTNVNEEEAEIERRLEPLIAEYCKFDNLVSTPIKVGSPLEKSGCDSPLQRLVEGFSPLIANCLKNNIDVNYMTSDFIRQLTPTKFMRSLANLRATDLGIESVSPEPTQCQDVAEPNYYPHSMLVGNPGGFVSSPSILENYLDSNNNDQHNNEKNQNNDINQQQFPGEKYQEEIIGSSHENMWQNISSCFPGNILPPVMMSSYEEMLNFQQEVMQLNKGSEHLVLPIYFQPFAVAAQNNREEGDTAAEIGKRMGKRKYQTAERRTAGNSKGGKMDQLDNHGYDEDLLRKCQQVCFESESYIQGHIENSGINHNDSMKYLEEAAVKLLLNSVNGKPPKKRPYQRRTPRNSDDGRFKCRFCEKTFNRMFTLQTHERVHSGEKPYKCDICERRFRQSGTKLNHMRAVHAKAKPFKCDFCPKNFGHKSSLVVHRRIHTKEKPYKCDTCGRKFTDRATLKKHLPTHTREKKYKCDICGKCLTQQSNLQRHIRTIHKFKPVKEAQ